MASSNVKSRLSGGRFNQGISFDSKTMKDARDMLIMKKRLKIKDARDKIVEKSRVVDAREKLNKLKRKSPAKPQASKTRNQFQRRQGTTTQTSKDAFTSKATFSKGSLKRTIVGNPATSSKSQKFSRYASDKSFHGKQLNGRSSFRSQNNFEPLTKTIIRDRKSPKRSSDRGRSHRDVWERPISFSAPRRSRDYKASSSLVRFDDYHSPKPRPVYKDYDIDMLDTAERISVRSRSPRREYNSLLHEDDAFIQEDVQSRSKISSHMGYESRERDLYKPSSSYSRYEEDTDNTTSLPRNLEYSPVPGLSQHTSVVSPGYKIIVSNLNPLVIEEDVFALFRSIGPLIDCRILKPGMAEVQFSSEVDAFRAVRVFDQRTLDDRPMDVVYMGNRDMSREFNGSSRQVLSPQTDFSRKPAARSDGPYSRKSRHDIEPDIGTIHRVLFKNRKSSEHNRKYL